MESSFKETIERADALYRLRAEIENVRASLELLENEAISEDYEALWRMSRSRFFLGQEAKSRKESRGHYLLGASVSSRAAQLRGRQVEGHFWHGVNLALLAQLENPFRAILQVMRAKRSLERAVRIDPAHHAAGPLRVLARLQHKLPTLLGGGHELARENFKQAISLAPANTVTRIYFAELLIEIGDEAEAREHLAAILNMPPDSAWAFETERDQKSARELLKAKVKRSK